MATTPAQIDIWRASHSEHQRLEFKEAKNQFDNQTLYQYCVAIANEGGGVLLLGVKDKPPRDVVGSKAFHDPVAMAAKLFTAVGFRVDIEAVMHPDGRVVVFHIPSRPRGTAYNLEGKYLMRAGEQLVPMSEDQLRKIFGEGQPNWAEEACLAHLTAQQVVELLDVQTFFELLNIPYPNEQRGVLDRLLQERLIDESNGEFAIKRITGLLLARRMRDFPIEISRKAARVVVYKGGSKLETKLDQTGGRGYAAGFQSLVKYVMGQLPQNEVIENALRREEKLVPEIAIRELVANAMIHQDLTLSGSSLMVEVYDDRVEISNPGEPIVPVERFIDGYQSRNERLADLMRRMHICEEKSSGVVKVVQAAEMFQLPAPDFRAGFNRTSAILFGPLPFEALDREGRIRACYQHCCLRYVMSEKMTNQSLRERFKLSEDKTATVSQIISATVEAGMIKVSDPSQSSTRYRSYLPIWA